MEMHGSERRAEDGPEGVLSGGARPDDVLAAEVDAVRSNDDFAVRARRLLARDRELLARLAK